MTPPALSKLVVGLIAAAAGAPPASAQSVQEVLLAAKPAVVHVAARIDADATVDCGAGATTVKAAPFVEIGTAWFVDGRGFLVTNARVVDPAHRPAAAVVETLRKRAIEQACVKPVLDRQGLTPGTRPDIEEPLRRVDPGRVAVKTTPSVTVVLANGTELRAEIVKFSPPLRFDPAGRPLRESGRDLALLRVAPGVYPSLALGLMPPRIGEPVHVLGFPAVVLRHELLGPGGATEASVTNGVVSGFKEDALGQDIFETDAAAAHGNSGGPAVGAHGDVLGVLTFVPVASAGGVVQGFNFLIPAHAVRAFLQGTDAATPTRSAFDEAWRRGIADLFAGSYRSAAARLAEADRLLPGLPDVKRALGEAQDPPLRPWRWIATGVALVAALGAGVILYRRVQGNRLRIRASEVAKLVDQGASPVVLDVRSEAAQKASVLRIPGAMAFTEEALERGDRPPAEVRDRLVVAYCT